MVQKKTISNNDKIFPPIFVITLILISVLVGDFITTFFVTLISIVVISFVYSVIKIKSFGKDLINKLKESSYILSFSFLTTLIFAIILPYFLFHNSFVNVFIIQYVYLLPILLIFFASLKLYSILINKIQLNYKHLFKLSFSISLIISVLISLFLIIGSNYIYIHRTQIYNQGFDESISELNMKPAELYKADYTIFSEIKTYQNNFIEEANKQKNTFQNLDANKGLCIQTNCAKSIVDKAYHLATVVVNSAVIQGTLKQANDELEYINSAEFKLKFASLDEYKTYLKNKIDASKFAIVPISDENRNTLNLLESEFNYQDFKTLIKKNNQEEANAGGGLISMFSETNSIFETNSLFYDSLSYTMQHSTPFKELLRLVMKFSIYTGQQGKNNDLFVEIYNNKGVDESTESKIIRYKIILNQIDK